MPGVSIAVRLKRSTPGTCSGSSTRTGSVPCGSWIKTSVRISDALYICEKKVPYVKKVHLTCPQCHSKALLRPASVVYGSKADPGAKVYVCARYPACNSYVNAHRHTNQPMGTLADAALRRKRREAHLPYEPGRGIPPDSALPGHPSRGCPHRQILRRAVRESGRVLPVVLHLGRAGRLTAETRLP